ncbi:MAG: ssDNA-binding domain-containing protein [Propionibacteriaceae bacterium]|jgi:antirestriction protein ArdC|nr:ssDNA-binding domain-containing protein [Propionibacteriaceae bacterium]
MPRLYLTQDERDERLTDLHTSISEQVSRLTSEQAWKDYLKIAARFHHYSFNNQMLIMVQNPEARHVAGYRRWQHMGRQVRKGETGIAILAPVTKREVTSTPSDPMSWRDLGYKESPKPGEVTRTKMVSVKGTFVFDYDQTDGDPIEALEIRKPRLVEGAAPHGLWESVVDLIQDQGFTVHDVNNSEVIHGANGVTDFADRTVQVRRDMDAAARVKTLIHEYAHIALDHENRRDNEDLHRGVSEVEAESVAYLVGEAHGMDTSQYSIPYVAGWAETVTTATSVEDVIKETGSRVTKTAATILQATFPKDTVEESVIHEAALVTAVTPYQSVCAHPVGTPQAMTSSTSTSLTSPRKTKGRTR